MSGKASSITANSDSVELFVLILCALDMLIAAPAPSVIIVPVCPLQSECVPYESSTYQWIAVRLSTEILNFMCLVPHDNVALFLTYPSNFHLGLSIH